MFAYTLNEDLTKLTTLIRLVPGHQHYMCSNFLGKHLLAFENAFKALPFDLVLEQTNIMYYLPREKALQFDVTPPEGVTLKQLSFNNIFQIIASYPYEGEDPVRIFEKFIKYNPNYGAFEKETGNLMGWVTRYHCGTIATLQVEEQYRRRGIGELLVKALAKTIAEMGDDCTTSIVVGNPASKNLFEKIGFKNTGVQINWLEYRPDKDFTFKINDLLSYISKKSKASK